MINTKQTDAFSFDLNELKLISLKSVPSETCKRNTAKIVSPTNYSLKYFPR